MKFLYMLCAVCVIGTVSFVSGCGTIQTHLAVTNMTTNTLSSPKEIVWIEYARYTASQAHQDPTYWILTNKQVTHIGQLIGAIDAPSTQSGWHWNGLNVGTKFFAIPGTSSTKAFAVQTKNGVYLEAVLVGSKKPN